MDVNLNTAQCIVRKTDILSTTIYNICTGTQKVIPHGTGDLVASALMFAVIFAVLALVGCVVFMIARD